MRGDDDRAAERFAGVARGVDGFDHLLFVLALHRAKRRIIVDRAQLLPRWRIFGITSRADRDHSRANLDAERAEQLLGHPPCGDARCCLARRGALQNVAKIAAVVFHPPDEIGMTWPRRVDAALLGFRGVDVPWIHRITPIPEIAIANGDGDRRSDRLTA